MDLRSQVRSPIIPGPYLTRFRPLGGHLDLTTGQEQCSRRARHPQLRHLLWVPAWYQPCVCRAHESRADPRAGD
jgi:hypothetical protein